MLRNVWHEVPGHPEISLGQYVVPNFVSNSVCVQLADNEYVLYSPGRSLLASWPKRNETELTLHIILPNAYHHLGVSAWLEAFPKVHLYASEKAKTQLIKKKALAENHTLLSLQTLQTRLPDQYLLLEPPGHRAGDVWLVKRGEGLETVWITCDSFLNYERLSNQPIARFMQKILGAAPGLKMSQVVKWFIMDERKKFKQWALDRLGLDQPRVLIPSHGELAQSEHLADEICKLIMERL